MTEDLIKRSDVIETAYQLRRKPNDEEWEEWLKAFNAIPSADRPQGTWFKDDEGTFICSACGSGYKDQPTLIGKPMFKCCPICGANMKGVDNE